jgi:hypothetical protein
MKKSIMLFCLFAFFVSGCAARAPFGSFAGPLPESAAVSAIASDAVKALAEIYPPGRTALRLLPAKEVENAFAAALESGLRAKGFTLAADNGAGTLTLAYTLDVLECQAAWYLRLRLSDGKVLARAYDAAGSPEAGTSRTVIGGKS